MIVSNHALGPKSHSRFVTVRVSQRCRIRAAIWANLGIRTFGMRSTASSERLIDLFLDMLAAEQGAGDNTLDAYRRDLTDLSVFLARGKGSFVGVGTDRLRDYLADLDTRGFKSSSIARRLSAMRHLFRFLLNERIRSDDPAAILSGPKRGRGLPKVLSIS